MAQTKTKLDLVRDLSYKNGVSQEIAQQFTETFIQTIQSYFIEGNDLQIRKFGTWRQVERKAKVGRNVSTKERIHIPAKTAIKFTLAKDFESIINNK
jgi:nucleoid DNA-binding protein